MSRSSIGACCIGVISAFSSGGATAVAAETPLFSQCESAGSSSHDRLAGRVTREGRSVIAPAGAEALEKTAIPSGLLVFGLRPDGWRAPSMIASADRSKHICPPAAKL